MADLSLDEAHAALMSPNPWAQYSGSVGLRNFAAAAQATADYLRTHGSATFMESGSAGVMTSQQAELHAQWFEKVAGTASSTADQLDAVVKAGYQHQTEAETYYAEYQNAVTRDSGANASGADDMYLIHTMQSTQRLLNQAVDGWSSTYHGFAPADPPPPPPAGTGTGTNYTGSGSTGTGSGTATHPATGTATHPATGTTSHDSGHTVLTTGPLPGRGVGDPGSIQVGPSGGEFAGWFRDPRTGYYVDPTTGREFDPVTNRWVDPVTGLPFGEVTKYATGLQGLGVASTTGGLLADTAGTAGAGGLAGAGGFSGLLGAGNATAVAGFYGGMLPPSLSAASAASNSLWQQASRSLAVKQSVAATMLAREQAARAGRAYLPPTQAGLGAGAGSGARRRPGYLTADAEEAGLFSSQTGRRAYLPPTQAGAGKDEKESDEKRPDWLVDDDVFGADPAPSGVLGDE